jgi:adenosylmethionine-8-amino-7-oxononanoate aminotransferase
MQSMRAGSRSALSALGYDGSRFAGRYAIGANAPVCERKGGATFERVDGPIRVVGGAASEILGGANLAAVLEDGFAVEARAMAALRRGESAEALSVHTSAGVPAALDRFLAALAPHVPRRGAGDWCVNLQAEGASAVHAAVDLVLQAAAPAADLGAARRRTRVACGAASYHGPASTTYGGGAPLGPAAKGLAHPALYPCPSPFSRRAGERDGAFHARLLAEFRAYLDAHAADIGVLLVEPQWGSSAASLPWPPALLRSYVAEAKARGVAVVADEVMCGLGRHGREPRGGGTGCFLTECWDLDVDAVTFGKSIGGGAGHLLAGAVLLRGADGLARADRTALQSHTYAASSTRALLNGANILERLPGLRSSVAAVEAAIAPAMRALEDASRGAVVARGQGALWGGLFNHADAAERRRAAALFKGKCHDARLLPYFIPVGGFMLTPRYDDDPARLREAVADLADCALETAREMDWRPEDLLPRAVAE